MAEVLAAKAARPAVMKPYKVNGHWRQARMSAKAIAKKRKQYITAGREWKWDIPHKIIEKKIPFKGKKRDLEKLEKQKEIERCMARMPTLIAEFRERERKRRAKRAEIGLSSIEKLFKTPRKKPGIIVR